MSAPTDPDLPTFVIIGAAKCGTTSLLEYLGTHPDVFVSSRKELHFFETGGPWGPGKWNRGIKWYRSWFADAGDATARGEATPNYTNAPKWPGVPERMHSVIPGAKLLYLVRDPVDRLRSQYAFNVATKNEVRPIAEAIDAEPRYIDRGRYAFQLELFLERFDREQLLVLSADALRSDRTATVRRALEHIDVDPDVELRNLDEEHNIAHVRHTRARFSLRTQLALARTPLRYVPKRWKRRIARTRWTTEPVDTSIPPDVEARLWEIYDADLARLRIHVGPDFDLWGRA